MATITIPQLTQIPFAPIREKLRAALTQYKKNNPEKFVEYDVYQDILNQIGTKDFLNTENINQTLKEQGYQNIAYESLTLLKIAILFESEELVQDILAYGAGVNIPDPKDQNGWGGYTELHWAAFSGNAKIAQLLVGAGATIDARATDCFTPLHIAAERGHIEIAKLLITEGADINAKMWSHNTPLHFAVANNKMEMAKMLVVSGADISIKNCDGHTIKDIAVSNGYSELAEYIGSIEELPQFKEGMNLLTREDTGLEKSDIGLPGQEAHEGNGDN